MIDERIWEENNCLVSWTTQSPSLKIEACSAIGTLAVASEEAKAEIIGEHVLKSLVALLMDESDEVKVWIHIYSPLPCDHA
jgi:hypothetical protein